VGYYLTAAASITWLALYFTVETKDERLDRES
jgi:hypothetical protein